MSLLPERASYFEEVQACFLAFRGDGVALSTQDAELVLEWHERQVPCEVVCQGIRAAAERSIHGTRVTSRPRSLRACRRDIEREIARHLALGVGRASEPEPKSDIHLDQEAVSEKGVDEATAYVIERIDHARRTLEDILNARKFPQAHMDFMKALLDPVEAIGHAEARLARFEEALAIFTLRAQPFAIRCDLIRRVRSSVDPRGKLMSAQAYREVLRHRLLAELKANAANIGLIQLS